MNRLLRKLRSFWTSPLFVRSWFVPVWFILGGGRLSVLLLSFRRIAPVLGTWGGVNPWLPLLTERQAQRALLIGRTVRFAARFTPWESNCFPQAIAARLLLGLYRIPCVVYFGVRRDPQSAEIVAHAWVVAGRVRVTGGFSFGHYTVVGMYASPDAQPSLSPRTALGRQGARTSAHGPIRAAAVVSSDRAVNS